MVTAQHAFIYDSNQSFSRPSCKGMIDHCCNVYASHFFLQLDTKAKGFNDQRLSKEGGS